MEEKSRAVRSVESEETFNDYEFSPVPDEKKNTWKAQVFVWLGVGFCLTAFTLGGQIALGLGFWPTVAAVLVGGIILTVVGALVVSGADFPRLFPLDLPSVLMVRLFSD